jgi:hypothetical protein
VPQPSPADEAPEKSWLAPSWPRLALAAIVALAGFLLPQEVPLEWYPLNEPGTDINYLEITCASDKDGDVQIFYNLGTGINQLNSIYFPISPTEQTFTYTFPLPDGPITELRIDPVAKGGTLTIRQMRIINRRNEEIRRFTRDMFLPQHQIAAIAPLPDGWKITSTADANDPFARIDLFSPIVPVGKDHRNLLRCLLSTGYLAGMLFILLMAVLTATWRPRGWRDFFVHAGFMAGLAVLFAPVGNRGLIRNSVQYARFQAPPPNEHLNLELDLTIDNPHQQAQVFWDTGAGYNEAQSQRAQPEPHSLLQTVRFPLPRQSVRALRFDPLDGSATLRIRGMRVVDDGRNTRLVLSLSDLHPAHEIAQAEVRNESLKIATTPNATDPILEFSPDAITRLNAVLAAPAGAGRRE